MNLKCGVIKKFFIGSIIKIDNVAVGFISIKIRLSK